MKVGVRVKCLGFCFVDYFESHLSGLWMCGLLPHMTLNESRTVRRCLRHSVCTFSSNVSRFVTHWVSCVDVRHTSISHRMSRDTECLKQRHTVRDSLSVTNGSKTNIDMFCRLFRVSFVRELAIHVRMYICIYVYIYKYVWIWKYAYMYIHIYIYQYVCIHIQGGEDQWDALRCRTFSAKEPLIIGLFCGNWPVKIRHPTWSPSCMPQFSYIHVHLYVYICMYI